MDAKAQSTRNADHAEAGHLQCMIPSIAEEYTYNAMGTRRWLHQLLRHLIKRSPIVSMPNFSARSKTTNLRRFPPGHQRRPKGKRPIRRWQHRDLPMKADTNLGDYLRRKHTRAQDGEVESRRADASYDSDVTIREQDR